MGRGRDRPNDAKRRILFERDAVVAAASLVRTARFLAGNGRGKGARDFFGVLDPGGVSYGLASADCEDTILPVAAPGDAGNPLAITLLAAFGSKVGWRS